LASDDEKVKVEKVEKVQTVQKSAFSRFLRNEEGSDDEEGGKRVVRSAKDKFLDDLQSIIRSVDNAKKISDCIALQNGAFARRFRGR
jgi:translation initiation factor 3 subunit C